MKNSETRRTYARLAGRVVLSLLRRIISGENVDDPTMLNDTEVNAFVRFDINGEFEEDVERHMNELLTFSEELADDDDEEGGEDPDDLVEDNGDNSAEDDSENSAEDDDENSEDDDDEEGERYGMDVDEEPQLENVVAYPVLLTSQQRDSLHMLSLAMRDQQADDELLSHFHKVCLSIFTTQRGDAERHRFHLPIESFIIMSNLHLDGSIRSPANAGPQLSMLQYWVQFTILRDAMLSDGPASK